MEYTIQRKFEGTFEDAIERTREELKAEGFGVLCDIDVQETLRAKLGEDFRRYRILGACNPPLAHDAMSRELGLGALLPCNVVVYEDDEGVVVRAVDPEALLSVVDDPELGEVASEVRERFERVLSRLEE